MVTAMINSIQLIIRVFAMCFLMEIGSASNFTIAAMANSSPKWLVVLISGALGIFFADFIAFKLGSYLQKLPISSNLLSGLIMILMGFFFLFKEG